MNRRAMLRVLMQSGIGVAAARSVARAELAQQPLPTPTPAKLPRWRGFNLLEMFMAPNAQRFRESDFAAISELGFNFVRLPMDYRAWIEGGDWRRFREDRLKWIDEAVKLGQTHRVHVQLCFHRAPGYTVADPPERKSLWTDAEAQDVCALHWGTFAKRFQGVPNREVSFDLFNEPARVTPEAYKKTVERMKIAIREHDRDRLIVCDGREYGTIPPAELTGLGVASATRGYAPFHLTHYKAGWVKGSDKWAMPTYPMHEGNSTWDKGKIQTDQIEPWKKLEHDGVGVMVGEFGAFNETPHDVVIPWMRDCLDAWKAAGWGWALWNFRGSFGILDSGRKDVSYEDWHGHKLDRVMLKLLQSG